jgi:hypothetical protein
MPMRLLLVPNAPGTSPVPRPRDTREARLRPEFAASYPGIPAGEWTSAAVLADRVLAAALLRNSETAIRGRVLFDAHFEFRGGRAQGGEREGLRFRREM